MLFFGFERMRAGLFEDDGNGGEWRRNGAETDGLIEENYGEMIKVDGNYLAAERKSRDCYAPATPTF